uniref:Uncharacterized protein n=1 Tax=Panagrolaimus sp. ES5 TaxID=591445 RepID=A0AC34G2M3_9BILA
MKSSASHGLEQVQEIFESRKTNSPKNSFKKDLSNLYNSTLSLHIAAYENSAEDSSEYANEFNEEKEGSKMNSKKLNLVEKWMKAKQIIDGDLSVVQNVFEFPRQQKGRINEPKVMQFKASQRLLNPNESKTEENLTMTEPDWNWGDTTKNLTMTEPDWNWGDTTSNQNQQQQQGQGQWNNYNNQNWNQQQPSAPQDQWGNVTAQPASNPNYYNQWNASPPPHVAAAAAPPPVPHHRQPQPPTFNNPPANAFGAAPNPSFNGFDTQQFNPMFNVAQQIGGQFAEQQKEKLSQVISSFNLKYYFAVDTNYVGKKIAPNPSFNGFDTQQFNPMFNVAQQIGGQFAEQQKEKLSQVISSFNLKYYFAVDTNYVGKKIGILLFPFVHREWACSFGGDNKPVPAKMDINAPDLYVPLMAFITYILLTGFVFGVQQRFSPEQLGMQTTNALFYLFLENMIVLITKYVLNISHTLSLWHTLAFTGYKFVGIVVCLILYLFGGTTVYYCSLAYMVLAITIFL